MKTKEELWKQWLPDAEIETAAMASPPEMKKADASAKIVWHEDMYEDWENARSYDERQKLVEMWGEPD
ncbi:MAG: hypothetical protein LBT88_06630 [Oscillospiraceae bacterium]|jgi:hypothetical protein|nr:hypothetical protein [Oscillospiraceae bacterium]